VRGRVTKVAQRKNFGKFLSDSRTLSPSRSLLDYGSIYDAPQPAVLLSANCQRHYLSVTPQSTSQKMSLQENIGTTDKTGYKCQQIKEFCAVRIKICCAVVLDNNQVLKNYQKTLKRA